MAHLRSKVVLPLTLPLALFACTAAPAGGYACTFDAAVPGTVPETWQPAETNGGGKPGVWRVADNGGRRCVRLAQTANRGRTYNLLFAPGGYPADVAIAVSLRPDTGDEDRGGGVMWRARDANNYYIARWNPLEDNLRAYKVVAGDRIQLASVDTQGKTGWHTFGVGMKGSHITVAFDGADVLSLDDATFADGGRVGLWTKADAATSFDDFSVSPFAER